MTRFLKGTSFLCMAATVAIATSCAGNTAQTGASTDSAAYDPDEQQLYIGDSIAIAQTQYGKVKGFILRGIYTFCGIPYGASTEGENRFMPPQEPKAWEGMLPTVFWGDTAPQITDNKYPNNYGTFTDHWNYYDVSEDCLKLNVWTPQLADGAKRPVLVWLHGGGYTNGNGIEQDGYHGENLTRYGNIVFVSINHRLGPIGFSDFSAVDPKFADSGNVGALDMVAALKWVKNNIANFGGDPDNVTIMGQSGGGAKVCTLVAMDETKGLISKAVALSGNTINALDQAYSSELGKLIARKGGGMAKLQQMSWREYIDLANACVTEFNKTHNSGSMRGGFGPVADGIHLPKGRYFEGADAPSAKIPMLFCTTTAEWGMSRYNPTLEKADKAAILEAIKTMPMRFGPALNPDKLEQVYDAYAKAFPEDKPIDLMNKIVSSRAGVINSANAKAAQPAPVYLAWFGWNPPHFDGRMHAFHCLDISFWFKNTDLMLTHSGGGKRPRALSTKMADALLAFMRTGNPNCKSLPEWPAYTPETGATMMLNDECKVANDPDREARAVLAEAGK